MTDLDKLSTTIGGMASDIRHLVKSVDNMNEKVEDIEKAHIENELATKAAHKRLDKVVPKVHEHEAIKNKGLGIMAAVGVFFGLLGSIFGKMIGIFF